MKVVAPLMLLLLFKEGEGCTTTLNDLCVSETGAQTFSFSLSVPSVGLVQFEVSKENSAALLLFDYNAGSIIAPSIRLNSDVTFTGDYSTGDVSFVLNNVTISESGTYRLRNKGTSEDLQCLTLFVQATGAGAINATLSTESNSVAVGGTITFSCVAATKTSPPGIAFAYTWQVNSAPVTNANDSRYSFSENKFTINNVTTSDDNDQSVTCRATEPLCGTKTSDPSNSIKIEVTGTTATTSPPAPTTSTTASATTVTSTIPISKTTTSSTTTTMTTLSNATNPVTTTATPPKVSPSTTGSTSIRTATQEISASTTTHSSITTTMAAKSDKGLITMIIVVSVIGGILVIAIIFMLFLLGHWKNGFVQIGRKKHAHLSSHRYVNHRIHQMKRKHNTTTGRSEHSTFQPHHKSGDYSFYRGVKNPVFDETLEKPFSQDVYRNTPEMIHSLQYNECQLEHPYSRNWEEM